MKQAPRALKTGGEHSGDEVCPQGKGSKRRSNSPQTWVYHSQFAFRKVKKTEQS